jgi:hypothetical protein
LPSNTFMIKDLIYFYENSWSSFNKNTRDGCELRTSWFLVRWAQEIQASYLLSRIWGSHGGWYDMSHRPDDGGSKVLWNVGKLLPDYTALQPRRQPSSYLLFHVSIMAFYTALTTHIQPSADISRRVSRPASNTWMGHGLKKGNEQKMQKKTHSYWPHLIARSFPYTARNADLILSLYPYLKLGVYQITFQWIGVYITSYRYR